MKNTINITREHRNKHNNKRRGLEASVLIDARSPINVGSLLNAGVLRVQGPCSDKRRGNLVEVLR